MGSGATAPAPLWPFLSRLYIKDKELNTLLLGEHATWAQRKIVSSVEADLRDGKPVRKIVLKARQMGVSTVIEAVMFAAAFGLPGLSGLVVSHENKSSTHLLGMTRHYWDTSWLRKGNLFTPKHMATDTIAWHENGSHLTVTSAKNLSGGRSRTIQFLHGSEVAFWLNPQELLTGLYQAIPRSPRSFIFLESTANGVGNYFAETWEAAKDGEVSFDPLFFPWWQHPSYTADHVGLGDRADRPLTDLDDEEKVLARVFRNLGMDDRDVRSRLIWRREILSTECHGDVDMLHQEYPTTDDEAFIVSGRNVFPIRQLRGVFEPMIPDRGRLVRDGGRRVRFVPDDQGPLFVYRHPSADRSHGMYMVGGDPSKAVRFGDFAVAQVLNRRTWEQCAVWRARSVDPVSFAEQMMMLGLYYNQAMLAPENNMSGGAVAAILQKDYTPVWMHRKHNKVPGQIDNMYGWVTNEQTKAEAVGNLQKALFDASQPEAQAAGVGLRLHDQATYLEMKEFVTLDNGRFGNSKNTQHDDTVMALAIALTCTMYEAAAMIEQRYDEPAAVLDVPAGYAPEEHARMLSAMAEVGEGAGEMVAVGGRTLYQEADHSHLDWAAPPDLYGEDEFGDW